MKQAYIISSCVISNNIVLKNEQQIFKSNAENLQQFLLSLYHWLNIDYPKFYKMDNLSKLGFLASEVLLIDEPVVKTFDAREIGVVFTNANASLDTDVKYHHTIAEAASPAVFVYTLPNIVIGEVCIRNKFKGENAFFVFKNFDSNFLQQYVSDLFNNNILQLCICGWVDVLDENYKAVLFLVSTNSAGNTLLFNNETLKQIFKSA